MAKKIKGAKENDTGDATPVAAPRRSITRRKILVGLGLICIVGVVLYLLLTVSYRYCVFDSYIKTQFAARLSEMGIVFDADVFRVTVNPLELELKNATFNDKVSGEKLFFIRDAHFDLAITDLYSWQTTRDITLEKTEISGAEAWVKFDENGRSNFANIKLIEDEKGTAVNFKYDSVDFSLTDSVVHFGDLSRRISADAKNVTFLLSPEDRAVVDDNKRYKFDLTSTDSNFVYDQSVVENIDLQASGIAHRNGAAITKFDLRTPIGETTMTGTLTDWAAPKYQADIESSIDLTQASGIFSFGTPLVGVGNFKGQVTGEGETYKIVGEADSQSLRAGGVSLKGTNVAATVSGTNSNYEADGTAMAQMLTFDDFRIDFLKLAGNVRGTGTDFRWFGELQAAAAKSGSLTIGGLYLSDALAEYKDQQMRIAAGNGKAKRFAVGDTEFEEMAARNLKLETTNGLRITSPNASVGAMKTKSFGLQGVTGRDVEVRRAKGETDVHLKGVRSDSAQIKDAKLKNVTADELQFTDRSDSTQVTAKNMRADQVDKDGVIVSGVDAPEIGLEDTGAGLVVHSDKLRVAKIDTGSAILGSLNIGGVRMTIRQGRVEVRSDDIDAGKVALKKSADLPDGGNVEAVKFARPIFILEPSGRYRATADMSLGGGAIGSVTLGAARARVEVSNDRVDLNDLTADIMDGRLTGTAMIARNDRTLSTLTGDFSNLDIAKLLALRGGTMIPIEGRTTGRMDLTFNGTNFRNASGTLDAAISANAGNAQRGFIPVNGQVKFSALNGLFNIDRADLTSDKSKLTASGRFDLKDENSDLTLALRSMDASEIDRIVRVLGVSPELERQMDSMEVQVAGNLNFDGKLTGNLSDPTVEGRASLDSISLRGNELGQVSTDILVSPINGIDL